MGSGLYVERAEGLLNPARVYSRNEVLVRDSPIPKRPGVYAWYFEEVPPGVPTDGCRVTDAGTLLYVGIAPKAPPANGKAASQRGLYARVREHFRSNAEGSTLRLTLGCHLAERLGIQLRRVGSGKRLTFTPAGEAKLSEWMGVHARVAFIAEDEPWKLEHSLINGEVLPLNLMDNAHNPYYPTLKALRAQHKAAARNLPIFS
ncbi:GIY-YIG nuclease family protein [Saccharothrix sp. HUAS TT1]|uniref:GIY-YIG nuclease family protein n=1 Tax=unclassified Saccharothrix TaxID=2593673 RepID=UPI00345BE302